MFACSFIRTWYESTKTRELKHTYLGYREVERTNNVSRYNIPTANNSPTFPKIASLSMTRNDTTPDLISQQWPTPKHLPSSPVKLIKT
jgi:hypothetical protein